MIGTRQKLELSHRRPHQALTLVLQLAKLPYLPTRISALQMMPDAGLFEKRFC